jgi:hypothetical protein
VPRPAARAAAVAAAAVFALTGCGTYTYTAPPTPSPTPTQSGPIQVHDPGDVTRVTGQPMAPCHLRFTITAEPLADPRCTPGAFDPAVTAKVLCAPGYTTRSYRPSSSETTRFKYDVVWPAYGLPRDERGELDHYIPLALGGANDGANFAPFPGKIPNARDHVEVALNRWVCDVSGQEAETRLRDAQLAIVHNWTTAEQVLGIK